MFGSCELGAVHAFLKELDSKKPVKNEKKKGLVVRNTVLTYVHK